MRRGRLRVLLGAAPGVGKTYAMLEEGRRLAADGKDVVLGLVESHGRAVITAMTEPLELIPRAVVQPGEVDGAEMDVTALLARHPDIALVDELAHTNAAGSVNEKRWQDVETLLRAGISVISTVNIEHIESLNDVVQQITGEIQTETIPDEVLRGADQVEVVDLDPQALLERLAGGDIYPADRIDAGISNYFRLGNLTALRELTLLWLADEVDSALKDYRAEHGIAGTWEARERVVVALTGADEDDTLLRRGARIAARSSGGELLAVHVTAQDDSRSASAGALARQRALVEKLGGTYHQVVGDDIPRALVDFARASDATQLVLGSSRRGRLAAMLTGPGVGASVLRESGSIDVHIVNLSSTRERFVLPRFAGGALTAKRRAAGFAIALVGGPVITWILIVLRSEESLTSDVLTYQFLVVIVALVGGIWPALFAAVLSGLTLNLLFVEPLYTVTIAEPRLLFAITLYVLNAVLVSYVVDQAARRSRAARRAQAESELLATVAGSVLRGEGAVQALLTRTREAFSLSGVRLTAGDTVLGTAGEPTPDNAHVSIPVGERATLELYGSDVAASERRLLSVIAIQLEAALEHTDLSEVAREVGPLAETDKVRSALLSALSHDLRRPLAAATAAVSGLRSADVTWSDADRAELLATAEESLGTLSSLVTDLLDVSRLQAGALAVAILPVDVEDVVLPALDELDLGPSQVDLDLELDGPAVLADPGLLQRVLVNLLANAVRFSPPNERVRLSSSNFGGTVQIRISDRGPGVDPERLDDIFVPFQRLGDTDNLTGLGLGLALSKGFTEGMGGTLQAETTPGGGLTMVVALPAAKPVTEQRTT
ncbi:ATP-binding protein [Mycetocola sp. 2940]|uniref:sensor histidine kinase n=1 Tax=Mycetocola sp. 2940 TaxID=3156452 RepID=UPI0033919619